MKISLNWMKWYGGQGLDVPVDALVERIGAQLGAVEEVEDLGAKYTGVVVAKVVECIEHANSDHLHVCKVDDGGKVADVARDENGYVQVVCGAPNVREGLLVAWLPPGATVPESVGKEPFVLEAREIRGEVSNGMLASLRELALGDSHDGILEIYDERMTNDDALTNDDEQLQPNGESQIAIASSLVNSPSQMSKPGDDFAKVYGLDDYIIDIENKMFTHRPDCFGQLGVAREIAGISGLQFTSPDWYLQVLEDVLGQDGEDLPLEVRNEIPQLVPRFTAIAMSNVTVKPSPIWLQTYLQRVGIRPISNVVDITNFFMLETGQPSHAYDYDKVKAQDGGDKATIVVRQPRENERITLLNGKEINPRQEAIMIATETKLIGVGGVMGGADTEVDTATKNIILEVATFDMYSIRRTSMAHGLFTDAVTRFNKGQSPLQNRRVIAKLVEEVRRHAGGKVASQLFDINQVEGREWVHPPVPISTEFINARLGFQLSANDMKQLLENVEFQVVVDGENLTVTAPFWRTDVETREDVVEEVGRLYGFDKLPLELPKRSITPVVKNEMLEFKNKLRIILAESGANEVLTYSFVHSDLLTKVGQNPERAFHLSNALSPDLQYYRLSVTPSLLEKIHPNLKAGYEQFAIFEMGKGHDLAHATDDGGLPTEFEMLDLVYTVSDKFAVSGAAYYEARKFLVRITHELGLEIDFRPFEAEADDPAAKPYEYTRSARVFVKDTDVYLGLIGEYKASVRKALKLSTHTAGFSIGTVELMQAAKTPTLSWYEPLPRFPKISQDITLKVAADLEFQTLYQFISTQIRQTKPDQTFAHLGVLDIYQREDDQAHKQITLRLTIASYERTMTDTEVNGLLDTVATAAAEKFSAERM